MRHAIFRFANVDITLTATAAACPLTFGADVIIFGRELSCYFWRMWVFHLRKVAFANLEKRGCFQRELYLKMNNQNNFLAAFVKFKLIESRDDTTLKHSIKTVSRAQAATYLTFKKVFASARVWVVVLMSLWSEGVSCNWGDCCHGRCCRRCCCCCRSSIAISCILCRFNAWNKWRNRAE